MFDENMKMDSQVKAVTKSAYYQLWYVRKDTPFLSTEAIKTVMHCLATSRIDSNNSLLYGITQACYDKKLKAEWSCIQENIYHFTLVCRDLQWLPVREHVPFKI